MTKNPDLSHIQNWIFDLDNTLYRADAEFFSQIDKKITSFISRYLALQPEKARYVQKEFLAEYGTSLSGMMAVHGMDPAEFLDYVHDVDLHMLKYMGMRTVLVTSDEDWGHEPEITRPAGSTTKADYVDYITKDLTAWLGENS